MSATDHKDQVDAPRLLIPGTALWYAGCTPLALFPDPRSWERCGYAHPGEACEFYSNHPRGWWARRGYVVVRFEHGYAVAPVEVFEHEPTVSSLLVVVNERTDWFEVGATLTGARP